MRRPRSDVDLSFAIPSICAERLRDGQADVGLVPVATLSPLKLDFVPSLGIASSGPVRSILLISKKPLAEVRTLAGDSSSRTSVMLARIILERKYGTAPVEMRRMPPDLPSMLAECDAALVIGDPALHLDPASLPYLALDLGSEWTEMTGLPMVFAVWAGAPQFITTSLEQILQESYRYGIDHLDAVCEYAEGAHGFAPPFAREYLTRNIIFELTDRERQGLKLFRSYVDARAALLP